MTQPAVFICYRREDSMSQASRLESGLKLKLPDASIFRDSSRILPGAQYPDVIRRHLRGSTTLLVLIGPRWEELRGKLTEKTDWICTEFNHAKEKKLHVIPVLVGGAGVPPSAKAPSWVKALVRSQAHRMDDDKWDRDLDDLVEAILSPVKGSPLHRAYVAANDEYFAQILGIFGRADLGEWLGDSSQATKAERALRLAQKNRNRMADLLSEFVADALKDMCDEADLPRSGNKAALVARLMDNRPFLKVGNA